MQSRKSYELINQGSAQEFVDSLCKEALEHEAVHHEYLKRLSTGDLPDMKGALKDFGFQYKSYSNNFIKYLEGVLDKLDNETHRELILENLEDEQGTPGSDKVEDLPHREIYTLFLNEMGVDQEYLDNNKACSTVRVWVELFLQKCQSQSLGVALGAIGVGTEYVVSEIYSYFLKGMNDHTDLTSTGKLFFELHAVADEKHAADTNRILADHAVDFDVREEIRFGAISALNLRKAFWDVMLGRALAMKPVS